MSIKPEHVTPSNRVKFPDLAHLNRYASTGNDTFLLFGTTSPCSNASGLFVSLGHHRGQIGPGHAQPASFDDQLDVRPVSGFAGSPETQWPKSYHDSSSFGPFKIFNQLVLFRVLFLETALAICFFFRLFFPLDQVVLL